MWENHLKKKYFCTKLHIAQPKINSVKGGGGAGVDTPFPYISLEHDV